MQSQPRDLNSILKLTHRLYERVAGVLEEALTSVLEWRSAELDDRVALVEEVRDQIERQALLYVARQQPLGRDLLTIGFILRVSYDLYRIARYSREIVRLVERSGSRVELDVKVVDLVRTTMEMVREAFRAFYERDVELYKKVEVEDNAIDESYLDALESIGSKETFTRGEVFSILLLRHLERICDHAVYMASLAARYSG